MKRHIASPQTKTTSTTSIQKSVPRKEKKQKIEDECQKLSFWGQYGETCWFNALLMSVFYSQHSRQYVMEASKRWDTSFNAYQQANRKQKYSIKLKNLFKHVLVHKYRHSKEFQKDVDFFNERRAEYILDLLHKYDSSKFMINDYENGANAFTYIKPLYNFLGLKCLMIELDNVFNCTYDLKNYAEFAPHNTTYSIETFASNFNDDDFKEDNESFIMEELQSKPDILVIRYHPYYTSKHIDYMNTHLGIFNLENDSTNVSFMKNAEEIRSLKESIEYNNTKYELDSIILNNFDSIIMQRAQDINNKIDILSHQIAGITCNNKKYIYNGWTIQTKDPNIKKEIKVLNESPCPLIPYHWHTKDDIKFCIDQEKCGIILVENQRNLCFSFGKGSRLLVYVKKSELTHRSSTSIQRTPEYTSYRGFTPYQNSQSSESI
jgi:hypothetical protein